MNRGPYIGKRLRKRPSIPSIGRSEVSGWGAETLVLFLILYAASMKDDANPVSNEVWASIFWAELTHHPIILAMKSHVNLAVVATILLATCSVLRIKRLRFVF